MSTSTSTTTPAATGGGLLARLAGALRLAGPREPILLIDLLGPADRDAR